MLSESLGTLTAEIVMMFGGVFMDIIVYSTIGIMVSLIVFCIIGKIVLHGRESGQQVIDASIDDFVSCE